MPTSNLDPIHLVVATVKQFKPTTVLDIGCGFGKYGLLLREQLDIVEDQKKDWQQKAYLIKKEDWKTRIDAIEACNNYICDIQRYIYSNIYIGDVNDLVKELHQYDVILLIDVIEHFEKKEGKVLLNRLYEHTKKLLVVITPPFSFSQNALCGNEFEVHKSQWQENDFKAFSNKKIININNKSLCIFVSKEKSRLILPTLKNHVSTKEIIKLFIFKIFPEHVAQRLVEKYKKLKVS